MPDSPDQLGRVAETSRAVAFSDGVLAIVITLLVLDLRVPDVEPGRLLQGLADQWPVYLAYLTSSLYVGVVWLNHKATFLRVRHMDRGLHWANLGVLFTTALLPFPTAVLSSALRGATSRTSGRRRRSTRSSARCCAPAGCGCSTTWPGIRS